MAIIIDDVYITCSLPYIVIAHAGSNTSGFYLIQGTHDTSTYYSCISHITMAIITRRMQRIVGERERGTVHGGRIRLLPDPTGN